MTDEKLELTRVMAIAGGHAEARAVQTAVKLGFFDALASGPCDSETLAKATQCHPRATMLLANAMAALGLFRKDAGNYSLSDETLRFLVKDSPEYLGGMILFDE